MKLKVAFLVLVASTAACTSTSSSVVDTKASTGWVRLPDSPLSPREFPHGVWTGKEMLIFGGSDADPCPPTASCVEPKEPPLKDGAAFDPATGDWRRIANAPAPIANASTVRLGDSVYVLVPGKRLSFFEYRVDTDRWRELPAPPRGELLIATDDEVVAFVQSHENGYAADVAFDPAAGKWRELPKDPLAPSFDRALVWTGTEMVLLALDIVPNPNSEKPSLLKAAALGGDEDWRTLPDSEVVGSTWSWFWVDERVVSPQIGSVDGGETNNWGKSYPMGGMLDPASGKWSALPEAPDEQRRGPGFVMAAGDAVIASGWMLDVPTSEWTPVPALPEPAERYASAWARDRVVVWGGVSFDGMKGELLDDGWYWKPE